MKFYECNIPENLLKDATNKKKMIKRLIIGGRMDRKKVFHLTDKLGNEIIRLQNKLKKVNKRCFEIMEICPHEIVFKYTNNYQKKFFCPACCKSINQEQLQESSFNDSRIIPLTNLSLNDYNIINYMIRNEVYQNMELYYSLIIPPEKLANKMEEALENKQKIYVKTLKK